MKRFLLLLSIGILVLTGCAANTAPMDDNTKILQNAAMLLRAEGLDDEAEIIEAAIMRVQESLRRGERSVYLGFAPHTLLRDYAWRLWRIGREEAGNKMEKYSDDYFENNLLRGYMFQQP